MTITALDPRGATARGSRALVLSLTAVAVAGTAHTLVDGCLDADGLLLSAGICWPGAVALLGRRRRMPALLAWTAAAQVVTHVVLALTCGGAHVAPGTVLVAHAAAVVLTTAILSRSDATLWTSHEVRRALRLLLLPQLVAVPSPRRPQPVVQDAHSVHARERDSPRVLRGPPAGLLALAVRTA